MIDESVTNALRFLRSHTKGDLRFDEHIRPIKYVIAPDGRLIAPVMVAMLRSFDLVLFVPRDEDGAMQLQVTLEPFDERGPDGAAADRWRIYHGEPDDVRWAFMQIDAARFEGLVIDGLALMQPNPLAEHESRLCKMMNQKHAEDLGRMCTKFGTMDVQQPIMVGIDPLGLDVRAMFDVVRVATIEEIPDVQAAERVLARMRQMA